MQNKRNGGEKPLLLEQEPASATPGLTLGHIGPAALPEFFPV